ncbi:MAG: ABC transporter permease [Nocardioides sp.]|uniref:ABC transporter permease n=1 Tax=Nocardioides sp. TaxID=35761 RepID=UPI0039E60CF2
MSATLGTATTRDAGRAAVSGRRPRRRSGRGGRGLSWALRLGSLLVAVFVWQLLTVNGVRLWLRFDQLPSPLDVYQAFRQQLGTAQYYRDLTQSLLRILTGFAIAGVLGTGAGVLLARSRLAANLLGPLLEVARPIPAIALVPIAILVFPTNEQGIVFITTTAAFFPVVVSTRHAVRSLPTTWEEALLTMGASRGYVLRTVTLPGILPGVFSGLSVGMGVAWICVISAEMISGSLGLGYRTWQAYTIVDYPAVVVGMLSIGALGWFTSAAVELAGRRLTRWLPSEQRKAR